jgi:1-acyl-sn-glycerol-3-phosphate acyltransferase
MNRVTEPVHRIPLLTSIVLTSLLAMTACAGVLAYQSDWQDTAMILRSLVALYSALMSSIFVKLNDIMIKLGIEKYLDMEREMEKHDIVTFKPPPVPVLDTLMAPMKPFLRVDATGLDNIPSNTPHLFVMNHSLYGIEMPFLIQCLYKQKGIFVRGLADHFHFATPNGPILKAMGAVDGTRDNVDLLMQSNQDVLVYPGGGHEVLKHSSVPRYKLMWKERLGFARMAIKHKYPIIPCAAVGTEDMLETIMDIPVEFARKGQYIPIAFPNGKVQKVYFWFGEPISTSEYNGDYQNTEYARQVRDKVKAAVETGIKQLQERQETDPDRYLMDQFTKSLKDSFYSAYETFLKSMHGVRPLLTNESTSQVESDSSPSKSKSD